MLSLLAFMFTLQVNAATIDVMSYNVENLFDTIHDEGKSDWTFLPKAVKRKTVECEKAGGYSRKEECFNSDWTPEKLEIKLSQIKKMIDSYPAKPTILALVEIENESVVSLLAKKLGYAKYFVANSPDARGIDQAVLVNEEHGVKVIGAKEYPVEGNEKKTRNHFEVEFSIKGSYRLFMYVNHWPSQGAPAIARYEVAKEVRRLMEKRIKEDPNVYIISVGDYNTIPSDHPNPFDGVMVKDNFLSDLSTLYRGDKDISWEVKNSRPPGSYFFAPDMAWNLLDRIFISPNFLSRKGMYIDYTTYTIHAPKFATTTYTYPKGHFHEGTVITGVPWRYDFDASNVKDAGYSDHFPVAVKITY